MKFAKIKTLIFSAVFIICCCSFSSLGVDFAGQPEEMEKNISDGAKKLIENAYADVDPQNLHDHHVHLVGIDEKVGTQVNPKMLSWLHPFHRIKTQIYLSAAGVDNIKNANEEYIERLVRLIKSNKNHGKFHILAFDHNYNSNGTINDAKSEFYVSNDYMFKFYEKYPDLFVPVISVHPYRKDAVQELEKWAKKGVKWIKWLPNAQGIDAS
ncbi:MAG: hypothetical protein SFV53_06260, partial [Rickettsiales bacterium]|nr:hypothetical protein [Rickettsiales bacterium]